MAARHGGCSRAEKLSSVHPVHLACVQADGVLDHMGKDLALRFATCDMIANNKEAVRRELISPLLVAACAIVGGVKVLSEYPIDGQQARGSLDWALLFEYFSIVVMEVRRRPCMLVWQPPCLWHGEQAGGLTTPPVWLPYCMHLQAKLYDKLEDHIGQLAAEMKSARDDYKFSILKKRKRDDEGELHEV